MHSFLGTALLATSSALVLLLAPSPNSLQSSTPCDCHPDSYEWMYTCCDVSSAYVNISTPTQQPKCNDLGACNDQQAKPCEWLVTLRITTITHHDFQGLHGSQVVVSADDARGLNWPEHKVILDCDVTAIEVLTCDGAACLEADVACWDCDH